MLYSSDNSNSANCFLSSSIKNVGLFASIVADVTVSRSIPSISEAFFIFTRSVYDFILATSMATVLV